MKIKRFLCVIGLGLSATLVDAALTTNSWQANSGKWEIGINWDHGVPAPANSINFLGEIIPSGFPRTITIDHATVLSNALNNCLTISNLTLSGTSLSQQVLLLTNAVLTTPLTITSNLTVNIHTSVVISNAAMSIGSTRGGHVFVDGDLTLLGGALLATNSHFLSDEGTFTVGATGAGRLTVMGGTWIAGPTFLGSQSGSQGALTVAGGTSVIAEALKVGDQSGSVGAIWVTGGELTVTNNLGTTIGSSGVGQMTVSNGTWLASSVTIGLSPSSQGTLTVAGGTNVVSAQLYVGFNATGTVWLTGGQLTTAFGCVAYHGVGQMTVSNGTWQGQQGFVGYDFGSQGTLTVAGGTNVFSTSLDVALFTTATGTVWLTGGQLVTTNGISIGNSGVGQMTISNGTWLTEDVNVGLNGGSRGTLAIDGGTNALSAALTIGVESNAMGSVFFTGGQLAVTNASVVIASNGVGQVTQLGGTMLLRDVRVAFNPGSKGTLTTVGGTSSVYSNLTIGDFPCMTTGAVIIAGGNLFVTNSTGSAVLEVRSGTLTLSSGMLKVDRLVLTNACARFVHTGGTLILNNLPTLDPNLDADGDGIPNGYEQSHGLDPFNPADANADNDGDGQSNLAEFLAGTDPNNSASGLRILSVVRQDPDIRITWTGGGGTNYIVEAANSGTGGSFTSNFSTLVTISLSGVGDKTNTYVDAFGATNSPARYYRVRLAP